MGPWKDEGRCEAAQKMPSGQPCGGGQQKQTRNCTDGEILKCSHVNTQRLVSCNGHCHPALIVIAAKNSEEHGLTMAPA